jgi:hypothetical protein
MHWREELTMPDSEFYAWLLENPLRLETYNTGAMEGFAEGYARAQQDAALAEKLMLEQAAREAKLSSSYEHREPVYTTEPKTGPQLVREAADSWLTRTDGTLDLDLLDRFVEAGTISEHEAEAYGHSEEQADDQVHQDVA